MADEEIVVTAPVEVNGIREADYQQWLHHPVTKAFHKYLGEYGTQLREDHLKRWEASAMDQSTEDQAVGRLNTLTEVVDLQFTHICAFYQVGPGFESSSEDQERGAQDAAEAG